MPQPEAEVERNEHYRPVDQAITESNEPGTSRNCSDARAVLPISGWRTVFSCGVQANPAEYVVQVTKRSLDDRRRFMSTPLATLEFQTRLIPSFLCQDQEVCFATRD